MENAEGGGWFIYIERKEERKKGIKEICQMIHVFKKIFPEKWTEKVKALSWSLQIFMRIP
jgi:hypothetical protein